MRIGQGFDVHPRTDDPGRPLVLGGVTIPGAQGLVGHSDADALAHACCDALLGAAGLGDIGMHFPDTDDTWHGADSLGILRDVVRMITEAGWRPANLDCTVIAERPKLAPYREAMQLRLGEVVGAPVNVKATRAESLGAIGRDEGIACMAVALLIPGDR